MSHGHFFEDLSARRTASLARTITEADIPPCSAVSMDTNPMHLDADFASQQDFGESIAHGMLSAGLISAVLGTPRPAPRSRGDSRLTNVDGTRAMIEEEAGSQVASRG